jgi:Zn-dependent M28 family amino/carboxypeptidase
MPPPPPSAAGTPSQFGRGGPRPWAKDAPPIVPQAVLAAEHYNRLVRMLKRSATPKLEIAIKTKYHDDDLMSANVVAEIPGTDLKDEIVMLGGHFDAWHAGTGATDNAAGSAVCMEAVRILKAIDAKPRRTIRIALWTGEEEGLLGSRAYVTDHFGRRIDTPRSTQPRTIAGGGEGATAGGAGQSGGGRGASAGEGGSFQQPQQPGKYELKLEHAKVAAYFNLDNGTGKIRGVYLQGNEAVRPIFRAWLAPFNDRGASTLTLTNTGGTDHLSFDAVGLPGFQFIQDEIEYESRTHHSNMDVFDRLQEDDLKQASMIMATFVYHAATRDEKLPRKPLVGEVVTTTAE